MTNSTCLAPRDLPDTERAPACPVPAITLPRENPTQRAFFHRLKHAGTNALLVKRITRLRDAIVATAIGNRETKSGTVIALTGPRGGEGASLTSLLLARSLGGCTHRRIAWIDGSFDQQRFAVMSRIFGLEPCVVRFAKGRSELIGYANGAVPNICFLRNSSGERSLEFFSDHRLGLFLSEVRRHFDFTVIDMPPLLNGTSNLFLLPLVDRLYLVAVPRSTSMEEVRLCQSTAEEAGGEISGVILNKQTAPAWSRFLWKNFFFD